MIFKNKEIKKLSEWDIDEWIKNSGLHISDRVSQIAIKMLAKTSEERPTIEELCTLLDE